MNINFNRSPQTETKTKTNIKININKINLKNHLFYKHKNSKTPFIIISKTPSKKPSKKLTKDTLHYINIYHHQKITSKKSTNSSTQSKRLWLLAIPWHCFRWCTILKRYSRNKCWWKYNSKLFILWLGWGNRLRGWKRWKEKGISNHSWLDKKVRTKKDNFWHVHTQNWSQSVASHRNKLSTTIFMKSFQTHHRFNFHSMCSWTWD